MPLKGYRCPPGGEAPGRNNEVSYCLSECKVPCVSPPLLAAMYQADTGNYHVGDYLSSSMLAGSGCARQVVYERTEDFYDLPRKRYWPFRGTHAHSICEGAGGLIAQYGWLQEYKMQTTLVYPELPEPQFEDGKFTGDFDHAKPLRIVVGGTADAYNPLTKTLADMKSMADRKATMVITGAKGGSFSKNLQDEHVWQFNIYRWLFSLTPIPDDLRAEYAARGTPLPDQPNFPAPEELIMQGIGMMDMPRSGATYYVKSKKGTTLYPIDAVPVLPLDEIEAFVRPRALQWHRYLVLRQRAPVVPEDKAWLCKNCAFNGELIEGERCFPTHERAQIKPNNSE